NAYKDYIIKEINENVEIIKSLTNKRFEIHHIIIDKKVIKLKINGIIQVVDENLSLKDLRKADNQVKEISHFAETVNHELKWVETAYKYKFSGKSLNPKSSIYHKILKRKEIEIIDLANKGLRVERLEVVRESD